MIADVFLTVFFFFRSNVSLQYIRRSATGWKRARTVVGGREDNFWTETPRPPKKNNQNPTCVCDLIHFFIASYRSSQSRQFEPVCEPFWVWTQPQNDWLINDILVPCAAHTHLVWVHHIVLCFVSQQRAAKTSSLPLEATPSRRSPHWPDANRPPKGERAGLRSSLFCGRNGLFLFQVSCFLYYYYWFSFFLLTRPRYSADSSCLYSFTCRQAFCMSCMDLWL